MTKMFQKIQKTYFGAILDHFCPNLAKMNFLEKRALSAFEHSFHNQFHEKNAEMTDRQTGPSIEQGPKKLMTLLENLC